MRSISFNESTVLREYARIAGERGFVKEAAGPEPQLPDTKVGSFENQLLSFPNLNLLHKGQKITDGSSLLRELGSPEFKRFTNGWKASSDPSSRQKLVLLFKKLFPFMKKLETQLKGMSSVHQQAYLPQVQSVLALISNANADEQTVKQGASYDKLYDVSGETGENLIDSAHKGGGTATELTHSKTKENLVETIVEQQERDIEVIKKVPKGTYATLVNLYNTLSKMGFDKELDCLRESIVITATNDDIIEHTLITLADDLDRLGCIKEASELDELLKKKSYDQIDSGIAEWGGSIPGPNVGMTDPSGATISVPTGTEYVGKSIHKVPQNSAMQAVKIWQEKYNKRYNLRAGNPKYLKEDGVWGPATQNAYLIESREIRKRQMPKTYEPSKPRVKMQTQQQVSPQMVQAPQISMQLSKLPDSTNPLSYSQQKSKTEQELGKTRQELKNVIYGPRNQVGPKRTW